MNKKHEIVQSGYLELFDLLLNEEKLKKFIANVNTVDSTVILENENGVDNSSGKRLDF